jgi:hypothetical protein
MRLVLAGALVVVVAAIALAGCPAAQKIPDKVPAAPKLPAIAGKFQNDGCLTQPNPDGTDSYLRVTYDVTPSTWSSDTVIYGDEKCTAKEGTIHQDGPYTLTAPSAKVPGAFDVEMSLAHRLVTPHVDGFVALLQSAGCGKAPYAVNEPQDLLQSGCKDLGLAPCQKSFDIVKIDGAAAAITFGKRPADNDTCAADKRPAELSPVVLKKS